jgi:hypothetical protein
MTDKYAGEERRRDCPCKHLVQVAEQTTGNFKALNVQIRAMNESYKKTQAGVEKIIERLNTGSLLLEKGAIKFCSIRKQLKYLWCAVGFCGLVIFYPGKAEDIFTLLLKVLG